MAFYLEHNNKATPEIDCAGRDLKPRIGRSHHLQPSPRLGP